MKKDQDFEWQDDQQEAMDALKNSLTEAPALSQLTMKVQVKLYYLSTLLSRVGEPYYSKKR